MARQYSKAASEKVQRAMLERNAGTLKSGGSGKKVTSRKQAIAIGLSEARAEGNKAPKQATGKKAGKKKAGKTAAKKAAKKSTTKSSSKRPTKKSANKTSRKSSKKRATKKSR
jgi:hypothetical protein